MRVTAFAVCLNVTSNCRKISRFNPFYLNRIPLSEYITNVKSSQAIHDIFAFINIRINNKEEHGLRYLFA